MKVGFIQILGEHLHQYRCFDRLLQHREPYYDYYRYMLGPISHYLCRMCAHNRLSPISRHCSYNQPY